MGVNEMSIELENEYIELICTIYPDLAVTWGIPKCGYNDFTNWGIKQNINKLEQLLRKSKLQNANRNLWRDFLNFPYFTGFPAP